MVVVILAAAVFWIWDCIRTGTFSWGMGIVVLVLVGILVISIRAMLNRKSEVNIQKELMYFDKVEDRIAYLHDAKEKGFFDTTMDNYHNLLSLCYYELCDFERAIEENDLEREVIINRLGSNTVQKGNPFLVNRANEATYLMAMNRFDEAEVCINEVEEELQELSVNKMYKQYAEDFKKSFVEPHRARLLIVHNKPEEATELIAEIEVNYQAKPNEEYVVPLLKAELAELEGDTQLALEELEPVLNECKFLPLVDRAKKLKAKITGTNAE